MKWLFQKKKKILKILTCSYVDSQAGRAPARWLIQNHVFKIFIGQEETEVAAVAGLPFMQTLVVTAFNFSKWLR